MNISACILLIYTYYLQMSDRAKRPRKGTALTYPGMPGHQDYFVFYFLKTKTFSDPLYIGSKAIDAPMSDRLRFVQVSQSCYIRRPITRTGTLRLVRQTL